jgi:hypothetical protein
VSVTDAAGKKTVMVVNTGAVPLARPLAVTLSQGKTAFEIVKDECSGKALTKKGEAGSSCAIQVRAIAADNGSLSGTLKVSHPGMQLEVPLASMVSGMKPAALAISPDTSCSLFRKIEGDCGLFTVTNTGGFAATDIAVAATGQDASHFRLNLDCPSSGLPKDSKCTLTAKALNLNQNRTFSVDLAVGYRSAGQGPWAGQALSTDTRTLTADVRGWVDDVQIVTDGTGLDVTGPGKVAYGAERVIVAQNRGETQKPPITVGLADGAHFEILADRCTGVALAGGETCAVTVRPKATNNGALNDVLRFVLGQGVTE